MLQSTDVHPTLIEGLCGQGGGYGVVILIIVIVVVVVVIVVVVYICIQVRNSIESEQHGCHQVVSIEPIFPVTSWTVCSNVTMPEYVVTEIVNLLADLPIQVKVKILFLTNRIHFLQLTT